MKTTIFISLVSAVLGAAIAWHYKPPVVQVQTKETTRTITKIRKIKQPDGTVITEKETDKQKERQKLKTEPAKKDWNVAVYTYSKLEYGISVQRRVLGDFYIYGSAQTNGQLAVGLGWSF